jgi:hypothetical protein
MTAAKRDLPPLRGRLIEHTQINEAHTPVQFNIEIVDKDPFLYEVKIATFNLDQTERKEFELVLSKKQKDELRDMLVRMNG